jgi:hypothetical protein
VQRGHAATSRIVNFEGRRENNQAANKLPDHVHNAVKLVVLADAREDWQTQEELSRDAAQRPTNFSQIRVKPNPHELQEND